MKKQVAVFLAALSCAGAAHAQVRVDVDYDRARKASGTAVLADLSVNDTAMLYSGPFCIENQALYVPAWASPADLVNSTYAAPGLMMRVTVLPGKRLKVVYVDGAQAQAIAKGNATAQPVLTKENFSKEVRESVTRLFHGGSWGVEACSEEAAANPLRKMDLYTVDSINGFRTISELLKSVGG